MSSSPRAVLPIELGDERLAIDADGVLEILGPREWIAIPHAGSAIPGALAWRGHAVAILDLGPALGLAPLAAPATRARNVIVRISDDTVALSIDRVLEARRLAAGELGPVHAVDLELPCVGELTLDDAVVPVVDLDRWVQRNRRTG